MNKKSPIFDASFKRAKAAFDLSYYRWAQEQARKEVNENFPTLRLIKNALVYRFFEIIRCVSKDGQLEFLSALVKRAHKDGVELAGEAITDRDQELINRYLNQDRYEIASGVEVLDATFERRGDNRIYRSLEERAVLPKIDKKRLRTLVVQKLRPILGEYSRRDSSDSWSYQTKVGPWLVLTLVDANKKFVHLSYFQRVNVQDTLNLQFALSPTHWFGIGGAAADWKLWEESEVEEAVDAMCFCIKKFLDAAPAILEGVPLVKLSS